MHLICRVVKYLIIALHCVSHVRILIIACILLYMQIRIISFHIVCMKFRLELAYRA